MTVTNGVDGPVVCDRERDCGHELSDTREIGVFVSNRSFVQLTASHNRICKHNDRKKATRCKKRDRQGEKKKRRRMKDLSSAQGQG